MQVKLLANGREFTFSDVTQISILQQYSENKRVQQNVNQTIKVIQEEKTSDVVNLSITETLIIPKEGEFFDVYPLQIDQSLFEKKGGNLKVEWIRRIIEEAFVELKKSSRYEKPFKTFIPERNREFNNIKEMQDYSEELGGSNADWVEQALEWAQRISNGESWESICLNPDTEKLRRLVKWRNDEFKIVGGWISENYKLAPSENISCKLEDNFSQMDVVPLVVFYDV